MLVSEERHSFLWVRREIDDYAMKSVMAAFSVKPGHTPQSMFFIQTEKDSRSRMKSFMTFAEW